MASKIGWMSAAKETLLLPVLGRELQVLRDDFVDKRKATVRRQLNQFLEHLDDAKLDPRAATKADEMLAVLTEQLYAQFGGSFDQSAYTQAGLLGTSFFALALLADRLGRRASESEQLAEQREADLASLAELPVYAKAEHLNPGGLFMTKLHLVGHPKSNFDSRPTPRPSRSIWSPTR